MSKPKSNTIPTVINMFLIILGLYCLDLFFLKSDLTVLGDNFYSRFIGFAVIFIYLWINKTSVDILGITKNKKKIVTGIVYGIFFSVIPIIIAMSAECIYYGITDITAIQLRFAPPSLNYVKDIEHITPAIAIIIYTLSTFFGSAFKEMFFRGFVLKKLKTVLDFGTANLIQALLYMSLIAPLLLRNLVNHYYDDTTTQLGVFIVFFYLFHETIAGIKWGLITRVTGSTYVAIIDHFLYVFLANSVYITDRYVTWSFMTHMMAIQLISLAIVLVYYKINMKKLLEKKALEEKRKAEEKLAREERRKKRIESGYIDEKIQNIDEISPEQFKSIIEETASKKTHRHHRHSSKKNENNSKLNESKIESIDETVVAKKAEEYLESRLKSSHTSKADTSAAEKINSEKIEAFSGDVHRHEAHRSEHEHHHTHKNDELAEKVNSEKLEAFSSDIVEKKTEEYSNSLRIDRPNPKHPNPHDKIAVDSLLPIEIIEKENAEKISDLSDSNIDEFLKEFSEENQKPHKHHQESHHTEDADDEKIDSLSEGFNVDEFIEKYQSSNSSHHSSHSHSHHHSHHSSTQYRNEDDLASLNEVNTETFFDEYQKTIKAEKPKRRSLLRAVKDLGAIDDSESNDLI